MTGMQTANAIPVLVGATRRWTTQITPSIEPTSTTHPMLLDWEEAVQAEMELAEEATEAGFAEVNVEEASGPVVEVWGL